MNEMNDFIRYCMRRNIKDLYAKNEDGEYVLLPFKLSYEVQSGDEYSTHFYSPSKEETTFTLKSGKYAPDPRELLERHNAQKNLVGKYPGTDVTYEPDGRVIFHFNNTTEAVNFMRSMKSRVSYKMIDRKKVIKGLECCSFDKDVISICKNCPYSFNGEKCENNRTNVRCCNELKDDLLLLLKEQESSKIIMSTFDEEWYGSTLQCTTCGCRWMMSNDDDTCYCPHCGKQVKWE